MYKRYFLPVVFLALAVAGCQSSGSKTLGTRDGYFTWVDEQGQVRHTPIPNASGDGDKVGDFEGGEGDDREAASSETYSDEFNLENYPDGNQLEKNGYIRPGEPRPYFTWRDAQGNFRVSDYRPDTRSAVQKGRVKPPIQLTEASIHQAGATFRQAPLPEGADSEALAVLGIEPDAQSFFARWSRQCCQSLDRTEPEEWQQGREFSIYMNEKAPAHSFSTGDSPYSLVKLPSANVNNDFIVHLRSFAKDGLFVPSVAFLDSSFEPVRLVTDLVAEYVAESWHSHGYIHAYIPVFPGRGERWMVIFTRDDDLAAQTVVDGKYGPEAIPHARTGELGLSRGGE